MTPTEKIEKLKAETQWLQGLLAARESHIPSEWDLSKQEARVIGHLLNRSIGSKEALIEAIWWDEIVPDTAEVGLRVVIGRAREKLSCFGVSIKSDRGIGYSLDPPGKSLVLQDISHPKDSHLKPQLRLRVKALKRVRRIHHDERFYEGRPCPKGHTLRYGASGHCVACKSLSGKRYRDLWRGHLEDKPRRATWVWAAE